ncbi:uncharacterized protein LOC129100252 isoform X2 [Anoplopoma fimbria]|uniref:uncharacterized protein LOC129100252 isoform X2 n=1 Tax=Anoplopoma fimbria TaxID=229290 RepID=UPI0023EBADF6|nr:uncharacterized protein LOC129100252 isoform X2 [Anoplopoma fimbria]
MKLTFPGFALKQLGTFVSLMMIFIHNVALDKDLDCNCEAKDLGCNFYMIMPFCIIFILQLWTEKIFRCDRRKRFFLCLSKFMKAVFISLLWVISVLIDGDWAVCCWDDTKLACNKEKLTAEEQTTRAELKIMSMMVGMSLLCGICVVAAFTSSFEKWMKCCNYKKKMYKNIYSDEEVKLLKEILTTAARNDLTEIIRKEIRAEAWGKKLNLGPTEPAANQGQQPEQQPDEQIELQLATAKEGETPQEEENPEADPLLDQTPGPSSAEISHL